MVGVDASHGVAARKSLQEQAAAFGYTPSTGGAAVDDGAAAWLQYDLFARCCGWFSRGEGDTGDAIINK